MLPLESSRWKTLGVYYGHSEIPDLIRRWRSSIGTAEASECWANLRDEFLHQGPIKNSALAVVPYLIARLAEVNPADRVPMIIDLGMVHSAWQDDRRPEVDDDLAAAYVASVTALRALALECSTVEVEKVECRYLLGAVASLCGHGGLAGILFGLDSLSGDCPKCGTVVFPPEIQKSGYE